MILAFVRQSASVERFARNQSGVVNELAKEMVARRLMKPLMAPVCFILGTVPIFKE